MSRILAFRDSVEAWVRTTCPELREVDWYDGQFDITDLRNWVAKPPCAFIAASTGDDELVVTGESQVNLDCVLVLCDKDQRKGRDADKRVWELMERIFIGLRLQTFDNDWATPAWGAGMRRLMDPVIRREGVAFGVVKWRSGVTVGENTARERDLIRGPDGEVITALPPLTGARLALYQQALEEEGFDPDAFDPDALVLPMPGGVPPFEGGLDGNGFRVGAGYAE